jgi:hypothetical protein
VRKHPLHKLIQIDIEAKNTSQILYQVSDAISFLRGQSLVLFLRRSEFSSVECRFPLNAVE